ncbi:MAG: DUF3326 domain-containing protein [Planctomycetes bacterium]|nr:DUF3326 domain-containing protein [Planctomycetota bacterium]
MLLTEREIDVPAAKGSSSLLSYFEKAIEKHLDSDQIPVRFAVTQSNSEGYHCELGVLEGINDLAVPQPTSIFDFVSREIENSGKFNAALIIPTGIGADIGGHAGDAGPTARLLAAACDTLITHPNVVNASDINELPENGLYVEGSVIAQLLMGTVGLQKVRANRVMLVMDKHKEKQISDFAINAASAARAALGLDLPIVIEMDPPIRMQTAYSTSGCAVGQVEGLERLCDVLRRHKGMYDAVALATVIDVPKEFHMKYFRSHGEMLNPWGGVEAMLTHAISILFGVPSAHSPMMESMDVLNLNVGVVDPRMSAEAISTGFLHSVLKGLHRSPRIITDKMIFTHPGVLTAADVSCLVIPDGCVGLPTLAALEQGIPVIAVRENRNRMRNELGKLPFGPGKLFIAENYPEAVGIMTALKAGVALSSVRRPLAETKIFRECAKTYTERGSRVEDTVRIAKEQEARNTPQS